MTTLFDEKTISKWAYEYCGFINDTPEIKKYITNSEWAYYYCLCINDDAEVRKRWI